jgi:hypothetical protein
MSVYQLIYTSQSTPEMTEKVLIDILIKAQVNNFRNKLSGMLVLKNSNFMQLIEGNKIDVIALYNKIKNDSRHKNVKIILEAVRSDREMPSWAMGICIEGQSYINEINNKSFYLPMTDVRMICETMSHNVGKSFLNFLNAI